MLSPHDRTSLVEALRPPAGHILDAAVGTSFTLDLEAVLTAPLAFAMHDARETGEDGQEPVGLLEAVRRHTQRITVFCQAGQIAIPSRARTVFAWLEESVVEVVPPRTGRLFHPKVWVVRYRSRTTDQRLLRVLCATRNLTFDTSWDTLLTLDSAPYTTPPPRSRAATTPLADFTRRLPSLATRALSPDRLAVIEQLADELAHVDLHPPEPFTDLRLHVFGLAEAPSPFPNRSLRALVISPFLGTHAVAALTEQHHVAALVSRPEALDRIDPGVLAEIERIAVLNSAAEVEADGRSAPEGPPTEDRDPSVALSGLHAKLYLFDTDDGTRLFTGSANATSAAFDGNVEVLAELRGPASVGVASLLADSGRDTGFDDLLVDYTPLDHPADPPEEEKLQLVVDHLRHAIAGVRFTARVGDDDDDTYRLRLTTEDPLPTIHADDVSITAWPASLAEELSARALTPGVPVDVAFPTSLEGLTAFFAIRITVSRGRLSSTSAFLVTADLVEAPADRHSRLLAAMLRDPDRLLRYLLMLLSDPDGLGGEFAHRGRDPGRGWVGGAWDDVPVLEHLVRAVDRHPDRLDHFQALLRDLDEHRDSILPDGFATIWDAVWTARQGEGTA
ncbi:hypothetical protein [Euzebya sp.]|uniref:hypothetical protein n=1 Tax=Euzebya sp. TaxID=1971409 RepID=UPI003518A1D5